MTVLLMHKLNNQYNLVPPYIKQYTVQYKQKHKTTPTSCHTLPHTTAILSNYISLKSTPYLSRYGETHQKYP